jgi:acyl-coenzyme A synthetase/AMP-(fatty) acid ligase
MTSLMTSLTGQVVPTNVEKHLMTHPAVEDAAVVGQPHQVHGELPTAFVVTRTGYTVTADELIHFMDGAYPFLFYSNFLVNVMDDSA